MGAMGREGQAETGPGLPSKSEDGSRDQAEIEETWLEITVCQASSRCNEAESAANRVKTL